MRLFRHLGLLLAAGLGTYGILHASDEKHWSFQPLRVVNPPRTDCHPIDAFIERKLGEHGLKLSQSADPRTLVRRLFFDLHGLPPTPDRVAMFRKERTDHSIAALIDELLSSPRYGERWAQHWLDLVRYADTHGFEVNTERPNAWPYRDYVIRAFNEDRPYPRFILDQLAGDATGEDAATGFLVASAVLLPGQIGKDEASKRLARQDALDEIIVATGDTFLGLSIGCARCHDHKFDPITARDYYTLQAFFAGVDYGERPLRNPEVAAKARVTSERITRTRERIVREEPPAVVPRTILIDDQDAARTTHLVLKIGHGAQSPGTDRGNKNDPGGVDRVPNLSGNGYTWWPNTPGRDVFTYNPGSSGEFRVWISWGAHGSGVHTRDARYMLDLDGDLETKADQKELAKVDQYYFAGVSQGETERVPLWSGFLDAGVHQFRKESRIILRGGKTQTAITADAILLQKGAPRFAHPVLRPPVNPLRNVERFGAMKARFVRFTSLATIEDNKHEPCLDELEIFQAGSDNNVALTGTPTSSGNYNDPAQHRLEHINDGHYGNGKSWISSEQGKGWVQIELAEAVKIDRIVWARDRSGKFTDRLAHRYQIEVALEPGQWMPVASSEDRVPYGIPFDQVDAILRNLPPETKESVRADALELARLEKELKELETTQEVYAGKFREPDKTYLLNRGDAEQKMEVVSAAIPAVLGRIPLPSETGEQERRIALARWIGSKDNPLAARVMVNRVWQHHFGRGLVHTASDFGLNGTPPSHPDLLDWLAHRFIADGWSVKKLHRLILTSRTYQQASSLREKERTLDEEARLLWRFPLRRLEAEAIRDSVLAVSGNLNLRMGGPGFNFFKSRGGLSGFPIVETFSGEGLRRMIYSHKVRMERAPVFGAFDCPDAGQATPIRSRAVTALQALNLFNSKFMVDQSNVFAARIQKEAGPDPGKQVDHAFRLAYNRAPRPGERKRCEETVSAHGLSTLCRAILNSNEFVFMP
ncbi:MAG: hypothetical protein CMO35_11740 [Verrucomicrobiaceae bacterium]|nr:hypothetical protein [Verrucomicrobiaceae bacterium]